MKNKKILKAIAALSVGVVMAAGSLSLAACGGGHKHVYDKDKWEFDATGHWNVCTADGCPEEGGKINKAAHTSSDGCTVCAWKPGTVNPPATVTVTGVSLNNSTLSIEKGKTATLTATVAPENATNKAVTWSVESATPEGCVTVANGVVTAVAAGTATVKVTTTDGNKTATCAVTVTEATVNPPTPVDKENAQLNVGDLAVGNLTSGEELLDGIKVVGTPEIEANSKKVVFNGTEVSVANRLKLTQKFIQSETNQAKSMGFEVTLEADATILVYAYNSSSDAGKADRDLAIYDGEKAIIGTAQRIGDGYAMNTVKFDVEANNTYYIGAHSDAGVNIYYIAVFYKDFNETWTHHDAVPAECTAKGSIEYSNSNYGRYKKADESIITYDKIAIPDLGGHDYSVVSGSVTAATATAPGSAQIKCSKETDAETIELPILSSSEYTERPTTGTGTYKYVYAGVEITFEAEAVAEIADTYTDVYALPNFTGVTVGSAKPESGNGVYCTAGDAVVEGTSLKVSGNATATANAYVGLGSTISSGVVKISGEMRIASTNGGWTCFQIRNAAGEEIVGLRTLKDSSTMYIGYRADGSSNATKENAVTFSTSNSFNFEILINVDTKKVTITINSTKIADGVTITTTKSDGTEKDMNIASAMLNVNNGRTVYLNSITFATKD